jgi:hypothetical protein
VEAVRDGSTDASDRLAELDGVEFTDALDEGGATQTESPRAHVGDQGDQDDLDSEEGEDGDRG